jgi:hypothetical protein
MAQVLSQHSSVFAGMYSELKVRSRLNRTSLYLDQQVQAFQQLAAEVAGSPIILP